MIRRCPLNSKEPRRDKQQNATCHNSSGENNFMHQAQRKTARQRQNQADP